MDADFVTELREDMKLNRAAVYDLRQVNRTLVVAVNENVVATRETRDEMREMRVQLGAEMREMRIELGAEMRGMRGDMREMREMLHDMRDMLKANTEAILLVLDELRGSGGPSGATA